MMRKNIEDCNKENATHNTNNKVIKILINNNKI